MPEMALLNDQKKIAKQCCADCHQHTFLANEFEDWSIDKTLELIARLSNCWDKLDIGSMQRRLNLIHEYILKLRYHKNLEASAERHPLPQQYRVLLVKYIVKGCEEQLDRTQNARIMDYVRKIVYEQVESVKLPESDAIEICYKDVLQMYVVALKRCIKTNVMNRAQLEEFTLLITTKLGQNVDKFVGTSTAYERDTQQQHSEQQMRLRGALTNQLPPAQFWKKCTMPNLSSFGNNELEANNFCVNNGFVAKNQLEAKTPKIDAPSQLPTETNATMPSNEQCDLQQQPPTQQCVTERENDSSDDDVIMLDDDDQVPAKMVPLIEIKQEVPDEHSPSAECPQEGDTKTDEQQQMEIVQEASATSKTPQLTTDSVDHVAEHCTSVVDVAVGHVAEHAQTVVDMSQTSDHRASNRTKEAVSQKRRTRLSNTPYLRMANDMIEEITSDPSTTVESVKKQKTPPPLLLVDFAVNGKGKRNKRLTERHNVEEQDTARTLLDIANVNQEEPLSLTHQDQTLSKQSSSTIVPDEEQTNSTAQEQQSISRFVVPEKQSNSNALVQEKQSDSSVPVQEEQSNSSVPVQEKQSNSSMLVQESCYYDEDTVPEKWTFVDTELPAGIEPEASDSDTSSSNMSKTTPDTKKTRRRHSEESISILDDENQYIAMPPTMLDKQELPDLSDYPEHSVAANKPVAQNRRTRMMQTGHKEDTTSYGVTTGGPLFGYPVPATREMSMPSKGWNVISSIEDRDRADFDPSREPFGNPLEPMDGFVSTYLEGNIGAVHDIQMDAPSDYMQHMVSSSFKNKLVLCASNMGGAAGGNSAQTEEADSDFDKLRNTQNYHPITFGSEEHHGGHFDQSSREGSTSPMGALLSSGAPFDGRSAIRSPTPDHLESQNRYKKGSKKRRY